MSWLYHTKIVYVTVRAVANRMLWLVRNYRQRSDAGHVVHMTSWQEIHSWYSYCILYLFAQNHIDNFHVKNEILAASGVRQEHTGYHNKNTDFLIDFNRSISYSVKRIEANEPISGNISPRLHAVKRRAMAPKWPEPAAWWPMYPDRNGGSKTCLQLHLNWPS